MRIIFLIGLAVAIWLIWRNRRSMIEVIKMATEYRIKRREFLNQNESMTAAIVAIVEDTSSYSGTDTEQFHCGVVELSMTDCYRKVTYDFYLGNKEGREEALYKARKLAEVINGFVEALEAEIESIEARKQVKAVVKAVASA